MGTIPYYDEDIDEAFIGPGNSVEDDESYDDEYETQSATLFQDGVSVPPPEGLSSEERGAGSGHTQLGVAPGSSNPQQGLPGHRDFEPAGPTQASNAEFASSKDDIQGFDPDGPDLANPDGSPGTPHDTEAEMLKSFSVCSVTSPIGDENG